MTQAALWMTEQELHDLLSALNLYTSFFPSFTAARYTGLLSEPAAGFALIFI